MKTNTTASIATLLEVIGKNLDTKRRQAGLKKKELARLANVNPNTITAILSGGDLKISTLVRLTRVLGDTDWLMPLIETPEPTPMERLEASGYRQASNSGTTGPAPRRLGRQK